ncbi:hypothetical protein C0J52_22671 [Blattella germanica]|nr:hypothetical protein C0J52_22671 [Blattella germanica]PSN35070.1 hypothetical protein C0J52_22671 [Blattella germanica]
MAENESIHGITVKLETEESQDDLTEEENCFKPEEFVCALIKEEEGLKSEISYNEKDDQSKIKQECIETDATCREETKLENEESSESLSAPSHSQVDKTQIENDSILPTNDSDICDIFHQSKKFKTHMNTHTEDGSITSEKCKKSIRQKNNLTRHVLTDTHSATFTCEVCKKKFTKYVDFVIHTNTHTTENSFLCIICNKSFSEMKDHKAHMRSHDSERKYSCETCGKTFQNSSNLTRHVRIHTGARPYSCKQCNKSFSDSSNLRKHMYSTH